MERFLFAFVASLAIPYLLLSIRLHIAGLHNHLPVDVTTKLRVPEQHRWMSSNWAEHIDYSLRNGLSLSDNDGNPGSETATTSTNGTSSSVTSTLSFTLPFMPRHLAGLRPGRETVEEWVRQRREYLSRTFGGSFKASPERDVTGTATAKPTPHLRARAPTLHNSDSNFTTIAHPIAFRAEAHTAGGPTKPMNVPVAPVATPAAAPPAIRAPAAASPRKVVGETVLPNVAIASVEAHVTPPSKREPTRALLFTMDSIDQYVKNSKKGGASGEITIRDALVSHLQRHLNVATDIATSDRHFEELAVGIQQGRYAFVVLDAWTWAAKGWVPKKPLVGHEDRVFLLDFFGAKQPTRNGIQVPASRILTAFPTYPGNTFLGYAVSASQMPAPGTRKRPMEGVIWGKDPKHYEGRWDLIKALAEDGAVLHSTLDVKRVPRAPRHPNIRYHGHLSKAEWHDLLGTSMFMLGLGNPLVGPSAVDAVVAGCVYINPTYSKPVKDVYWSQHPYLADRVGAPRVCNANLDDVQAVKACVRGAVAKAQAPFIPVELTEESYVSRLQKIFGPFLPAASLD